MSGEDDLRLGLSVVHLVLACLGSVNLIVIIVILIKPSMRTVTNVYMIGLCLADFIYVGDLTLVAITHIKHNWVFGQIMCSFYFGTEVTSKYATILFVVLMAFDRYCALCKPHWRRFRSFYLAILQSMLAWGIALAVSTPFYLNPTVRATNRTFYGTNLTRLECYPQWDDMVNARWYASSTAVSLFFLPLLFITYFYYHILIKMRQAMKTNRRMSRSASSRAPYQRVTYFVLTVIFAHILSWTPFWVYTLYSSFVNVDFSFTTRLFLNLMHLLPYINCAANPFIYVANFRKAFQSAIQSILTCTICRPDISAGKERRSDSFRQTNTKSRYENELSDGHCYQKKTAKVTEQQNGKRAEEAYDRTATTILTNVKAFNVNELLRYPKTHFVKPFTSCVVACF